MRLSDGQFKPYVRQNTDQFELLVEEVSKICLHPEDMYEVAAILESIGWSDEKASVVFGVQNVFALASCMWEEMHRDVHVKPVAHQEKKSMVKTLIFYLRSFIRGTIFALPMALSVASMLLIKFSLWSYEYLPVELATAIAVGTILSFMTVGGFTQAIARKGFFYIVQGYYLMARKMSFYFIRWGFFLTLVVLVLIAIVNTIFNLFTFKVLLIVMLYFFFLNAIWLSTTVMYILRKELVFTGLLALGVGIVYFLFRVFAINIIIAQLIAMMIVSVIGMVFIYLYFKRVERKEEKGTVPHLPRTAITVYTVLPYFIYGFLYFTFLFIDRLVAFSTNDSGFVTNLWFRGEYELGLDFALLVLVVPMGIAEVVVQKLMNDVQVSQRSFFASESEKMNRKYVRMYVRRLVFVSALSLLSALLTYFLIIFLDQTIYGLTAKHFLEHEITYFVFILALICYVILAMALMNAVILFALSQPKFVNRALFPAVLLNVVSGFILARWFDHSYAIFGLLVGTVIFVILSTRQVFKVFQKLDYYLYAAS